MVKITAPDDFLLLSGNGALRAFGAGNDEVRFIQDSHVYVVSDFP